MRPLPFVEIVAGVGIATRLADISRVIGRQALCDFLDMQTQYRGEKKHHQTYTVGGLVEGREKKDYFNQPCAN